MNVEDDFIFPIRQVRARFSADTITIYQAYPSTIAKAAVAAGTFVPPFKLDRMTWIKPSFLWMMYRSGWATKEGQERIVSVEMTRTGFEEALSRACLSHFDPNLYSNRATWQRCKIASPVRVQWDPERSVASRPLPWRSLQVGLGGSAIRKYVDDWITEIVDITDHVQELHNAVLSQNVTALPLEEPYPLPLHIAENIGATI